MTDAGGRARPWEVYFSVVVTAAGVLIVAVPGDEPRAHRWIGLGLLAAMVVWYLLVGRRVVLAVWADWRGWFFQAVLLALFAAAMAMVGAASLLLFALCPLAYLTVRLVNAHVVAAAYAFTPAVVGLMREGPRGLPVTLTVGVVATTVSIVTGVTIGRAERVSAERAELIEELEATRADVARLSREAGIAAERQRLAGEIHDTVAQGLSSVVMLVEAAEAALGVAPAEVRGQLRLAARTARENLDETRAIVAALTPVALNGAPLADALTRLVSRFGDETGIAGSFSISGATRPLPTATEVVLLRVVQEALHNVRKHAAASRVRVELVMGEETVSVLVCDDGVGFEAAPASRGYGLGGMRARLEQIDGSLTIDSAPAQGTTIRCEVPA